MECKKHQGLLALLKLIFIFVGGIMSQRSSIARAKAVGLCCTCSCLIAGGHLAGDKMPAGV